MGIHDGIGVRGDLSAALVIVLAAEDPAPPIEGRGEQADALDRAGVIRDFQRHGGGVQFVDADWRRVGIQSDFREEIRAIGHDVGVRRDHHAPQVAVPMPGIPQLRKILFAGQAFALRQRGHGLEAVAAAMDTN